jgi:ribosomal protein S4E
MCKSRETIPLIIIIRDYLHAQFKNTIMEEVIPGNTDSASFIQFMSVQ